MNVNDLPILSLIVFTPLVGVVALLLVPGDNHRLIRWVALVASLVTLGFSLLLTGYDPAGAEFQFREDLEWIPAFGMGYRLGVDGISTVLVILTTVLSVVAIVYSFDPIRNRVKEYYATMLLLMVGMLGVFVSLDLFLFYVFWEISLIPMYLVIGIWGGPRRIYATVKFVIYTLVGSLLMLVAILAVAIAHGNDTGTFTFAYEALRGHPFTDGLQALGVKAEPTPDGIVIEGGPMGGGEVWSHGDHRIAMSFSVASLRASAPIRIHDCANVATSFPNFLGLATQCGIRVAEEGKA